MAVIGFYGAVNHIKCNVHQFPSHKIKLIKINSLFLFHDRGSNFCQVVRHSELWGYKAKNKHFRMQMRNAEFVATL